MFNLILKRTADVLALRLSVVFRWLVRLGSLALEAGQCHPYSEWSNVLLRLQDNVTVASAVQTDFKITLLPQVLSRQTSR